MEISYIIITEKQSIEQTFPAVIPRKIRQLERKN